MLSVTLGHRFQAAYEFQQQRKFSPSMQWSHQPIYASFQMFASVQQTKYFVLIRANDNRRKGLYLDYTLGAPKLPNQVSITFPWLTFHETQSFASKWMFLFLTDLKIASFKSLKPKLTCTFGYNITLQNRTNWCTCFCSAFFLDETGNKYSDE